MAAPTAGFTGAPLSGDSPLTVQFTDLSTGIIDTSTGVAWLWSYGDGETGALQSPAHIYRGVDKFSVSLKVTTDDGSDTDTEPDLITTHEAVSYTRSSYIQLPQKTIKNCKRLACIGWIASPQFEEGDSLIPLAIADTTGTVRGSDASIIFEVLREGLDYRLRFLGSKTKLIRKTIGINVGDGSWHMLGYLCDDVGTMTYYIDALPVAAEDGVGSDGISYSIAHARGARLGGNYVWSPHLYKAGQAVSLYNWRYASGLTLHQDWINKLMATDRTYLDA